MAGRLFTKCASAFIKAETNFNNRTICSNVQSGTTQPQEVPNKIRAPVNSNDDIANPRPSNRNVTAGNGLSTTTKHADSVNNQLINNNIETETKLSNKVISTTDSTLKDGRHSSMSTNQLYTPESTKKEISLTSDKSREHDKKFQEEVHQKSVVASTLDFADRVEHRNDSKYTHIRGSDITQISPHVNDPFYMGGNDCRKYSSYEDVKFSQERYIRDFYEIHDLESQHHEHHNDPGNTRKWWSEVRAFKDDKKVIHKPAVSLQENLFTNVVAKKKNEENTKEVQDEVDLTKMYAQSRIEAKRQLKIMKTKLAMEQNKRLKHASMTGKDWIQYWARKRNGAYSKHSGAPNYKKCTHSFNHDFYDSYDEIDNLDDVQRKTLEETQCGNIIVAPPIEKIDNLQSEEFALPPSVNLQSLDKEEFISPCKSAMHYTKPVSTGSALIPYGSNIEYPNKEASNGGTSIKNSLPPSAAVLAAKKNKYSNERTKHQMRKPLISDPITCALTRTKNSLDLVGAKAMFSSHRRELPKGCPKKCDKPKPKKKKECIPRCERKACSIKQTIARHLDTPNICDDEERLLRKRIKEEYDCGSDCPPKKK